MSQGIVSRKVEMEYTQKQLAAGQCITRKASPEEIEKILSERGKSMGKRGPKPGFKRDKRTNINELADQAVIQASKKKELAAAARNNIDATVEGILNIVAPGILGAAPVTKKAEKVTDKVDPITETTQNETPPMDNWDELAAQTKGAVLQEREAEVAKSMEDAVDAIAYAIHGKSHADFKTEPLREFKVPDGTQAPDEFKKLMQGGETYTLEGSVSGELFKKPPLGLMPKWLHDESRMYEIIKAVARYSEAEMPVPFEWMDELESLIGPVLKKIRKTWSIISEEDCSR